MRWNHIKTVTLCLLLIVNVWMIFLLVQRHIEQSYLNADALQNAVEILAEDEIYLPVDQLDQERRDAEIYAAVREEDYYESAAAFFTASPIADIFPTPSGLRILTEAGDSISFSTAYGVTFVRAGENRDALTERAAQIAAEGEKVSVHSFGLRNLRAKIEQCLNSTVGNGGGVAANARLHFDAAYRMDNLYLVRCSQTIDDRDVLSHSVLCLYTADGELLYLDGTWSFLSLMRNYSAQLYDQINILFIEKATVDELRAGGEISGALTMESLSLCYVLTSGGSADSGDTMVYFAPAWKITYTDGSSRVYHAVTGTSVAQ
ncbi:MAG: hypothetical protein IJF49_07215 [Clostridia bacterium]|nr:hypothetical protein [Clostridia bacterium]